MPDEEQTAAESAAGSEPADPVTEDFLPETPEVAEAPAEEIHAEPEGRRLPRVPAKPTGFKAPAIPAEALPRRPPRRRRRPAFLAWAGLLLFCGCLYGLLNGDFPTTVSRSSIPGPALPESLVVVIDPGHGGMDSGAVAQGVVEKDLNLDVGLRVAQALQAAGLEVKLTREDDHYVPLESRVEMANAFAGSIFVSIHFNDAQGEGRSVSRASGIETYYSGVKELPAAPSLIWTTLFRGSKTASPAPADAVRAGELLAGTIQHSLIANTGAADRGIKEEGLYVTRRVRGPAVLVEGGFVSHPQEAHLLQDPEYRQRIANSIAAGIVSFLQAAQPGPGGSPPPPPPRA